MDKTSQLLRDEQVYPSEPVLATALGSAFAVYQRFFIVLKDIGIEPEWRFYHDGKAWLCKGVNKKKTVLWLSVWDGYFKVSLFFTERTRGGIQELAVADEIKEQMASARAIGKLIPLTLDVLSENQLSDLETLAVYKKTL